MALENSDCASNFHKSYNVFTSHKDSIDSTGKGFVIFVLSI